ncbi:hypothetical protein GCM10011348_17060 [Marinobacterium nitratireducens]|uniref:Cytochrome c domain-containing protein n=1 Tax=Marinobacterium nitratireducens TaxID=518897 RepID=A0A918DQU7_9GAMM|nr:hypothetical protein [Marinobacterium nitratireducens]GGO80427.1 hypothetical protein GCM10011348_17060 [Marinobacterium nitratireducens]
MRRAVVAVLCLALPVWAQGRDEVPAAVAGCVECHQAQGLPGMPGWPRLAGMERSAIVEILRGHRDRLIPDSTMDKVAAYLDDAQIDAAADYFSRIEPGDPSPFDFGD